MSKEVTLFQVDGRAIRIIQLMSCLNCIEKVKGSYIGDDGEWSSRSYRGPSEPKVLWRSFAEEMYMPPTLAATLIEEGWTLCSLYSPFDRTRFIKNTPITPSQWERLQRGLKRTKSLKEPCELCYKGVVWVYNGDSFGGKATVWAVKTLTELETLAIARRNHAGCVREEPQTV